MISNDDIDTLARATAYGPDGDKLGRVGEVYLDNDSGRPAWITVVTGLFGTRRHFAPIDEAVLDSTGVRLPYDKDTITGAPNVDENGELTPLEEDELYRYYRRAGGDPAGDVPVGSADESGITGTGDRGVSEAGASHDRAGAGGGGLVSGIPGADRPGGETGAPHASEQHATATPPTNTPTPGQSHAPSPDFAREGIAGDYRPSEGQRDESLEHSMPGHTGSTPSAPSAPSAPTGAAHPGADSARHAAPGSGADQEIVGPGPTGPAHFTPPARNDAETESPTPRSEHDPERPRKPRLVRRVVTTEYYEEVPDDDAGRS